MITFKTRPHLKISGRNSGVMGGLISFTASLQTSIDAVPNWYLTYISITPPRCDNLLRKVAIVIVQDAIDTVHFDNL